MLCKENCRSTPSGARKETKSASTAIWRSPNIASTRISASSAGCDADDEQQKPDHDDGQVPEGGHPHMSGSAQAAVDCAEGQAGADHAGVEHHPLNE